MRRRASLFAVGLGLGLIACSQGGAGPGPGPGPNPGADLAVAAADLAGPADLGAGADLRPAPVADLLPPLSLVPSFGTPIPLSNAGSYAGMDVADVNGDGVADVILANETAHGFAVWTGQGDGTLVSRGTVGGATTWIAASHARIADGSRNFFSPSRRLNRWGVRSAPGRVGGRTGVWCLIPVSGSCRFASLAAEVASRPRLYYLHGAGQTSKSADILGQSIWLCG